MIKTNFFDYNQSKIPYLIAEIGLNHNGNEDLALYMVEAAARAGAHAVKFQLFHTEDFIEKKASLPSAVEGSLFDFFKQFELPKESWLKIKSLADKLKVDFLCSVFDEKSLIFYKEILKCQIVKVASTDLTNYLLLDKIKKMNMDYILSTGATEETEIEETISMFGKPYILMQCVSDYPSSPSDYNLSILPFWKEKYQCNVGVSDHCLENQVSLASYFWGAIAIERHFTVDKNLPGPDQAISITPTQLKELKNQLEIFRTLAGEPVKMPLSTEENVRIFGRRSLYYATDLEKGTVINLDHIIALRPGGGIPVKEYQNIINRKLAKNVKKGDKISFHDFQP